MTQKLQTHAVILAGGRGTRFWPRSRTKTPKQLLNIVSDQSMLAETVARLRSVVPPERIWTVTNAEQAVAVRKQVPAAARKRVLTEPIGRNTAAAIGLAAFHIRHAAKDDAVFAVLPADHYIARADDYRKLIAASFEAAAEPGRMIVLGIPPTYPETGFGYIERSPVTIDVRNFKVNGVHRFTEKPEATLAEQYVASGNYLWNAGMFFWRVETFLNNLREFLPKTYKLLEELAGHIGKSSYEKKLRAIYPKLENISVDYAILERATRREGPPQVYVIPAEIGWSDIGSWDAVYGLLAKHAGENVFPAESHAIDASGNFVYSPKKFVGAIGVKDLIVVDTPDALLLCDRKRAQDVGKLVKWLEQEKKKSLL